MAELPKSWGLRTQRNAKGTLDVIGKDDTGRDYKVRTTDAPGITQRDVVELSAADRERYSSRERGAREYVRALVDDGKRRQADSEAQFQEELEDAAGPVVRAGLEREGSTVGYSAAYARKFDSAFKGDN